MKKMQRSAHTPYWPEQFFCILVDLQLQLRVTLNVLNPAQEQWIGTDVCEHIMLVLMGIMSICCTRSSFLIHSSQCVDGSSLSFTWPGNCGMRCSRQASPMIKPRLCCWIWPRPRMTLCPRMTPCPWKDTCCLLSRERWLSNRVPQLWVSILAAANAMCSTLHACACWDGRHSSVKRTSQTSRELSTPNTSGYFGCKLLLGFFCSLSSFSG